MNQNLHGQHILHKDLFTLYQH